MQHDSENFLQVVVAVMRDWFTRLGGFAWVVLGLLLIVGIVLCLWALRFIYGGGLGRWQRRRASGIAPSHDDGVDNQDNRG
jgi:hypothetical protein